MSGKIYLITGANKGIGFALTTALAADPANIVLATARVPSKADDLNKLAENGNLHVLTLDYSSPESIAGLDAQLSKFAPDGIDYFISNAGIADGAIAKKTLELPAEVWINIFNVNVLGNVLVTQKVYPHLLKRKTRVIYLMSSEAGSTTDFVPGGTTAYGLSKAALNHFGKELSLELKGQDFIVVLIHPGVVSTLTGQDVVKQLGPDFEELFATLSITPEFSAKSQIELLQKLTLEDSGKFLKYDGSELTF